MSVSGPEGIVSGQCRDFLTKIGFTVKSLEQGYRKERGGTRMSAGIADLEAFHVAKSFFLKYEVKTPEGLAEHFEFAAMPQPKATWKRDGSMWKLWERAQQQAAYRRLCLATPVPYGIGDLDDLIETLVVYDVIREPIGHFRRTDRCNHPLFDVYLHERVTKQPAFG